MPGKGNSYTAEFSRNGERQTHFEKKQKSLGKKGGGQKWDREDLKPQKEDKPACSSHTAGLIRTVQKERKQVNPTDGGTGKKITVYRGKQRDCEHRSNPEVRLVLARMS